MEDQPAAKRSSPLVLAVLASLLVHAIFGAAVRIGSADADDAPPVSLVDIELAPEAPPAERLGPDQKQQPDEVASTNAIPEPEPPPPEPPPVNEDSFARDAGVDAAPPPPPEPMDAAPAVALATTDAGVTASDAGIEQPEASTDAGVQASAGTAANLLAHFPKKHMVSVILRFDRLRGTEWSAVMQDVLSAMPDFKTLIADPTTEVADKFDLVAMSSARWKDSNATILAVKSSMAPADLRDFLDEPGAPVTWSRVAGGVLGTRAAGDRVRKGDRRVFLGVYPGWTVLAKPKDLATALDPAEGDLDSATPDAAKLPAWVQTVPDLETESGVPDGPAVLVTLAPKSKRWELPAIGLSVSELPAPERFSLTAELDPQGFVIRGNLKMRSVEDAEELVKSLEAAQKEALDDALMASMLGKIHAKNLLAGLTLVRSDDRVSYASSISIADARTLFALGSTMVVQYFDELGELEQAPDPAVPDPEPKP